MQMSEPNYFYSTTISTWSIENWKQNENKIFNWIEKMCNTFINPGIKIASPFMSAGVAAKNKNPQSAEITSNILKSLTVGKVLSLTEMHSAAGWRLRVM